MKPHATLTSCSGGHVGMVWGWFIPCLFVMTIASCVAELTSSMPYVRPSLKHVL